MYKHEHQKEMSTPATAQMLSTMLYYKRFFPYYVSNILAGLDENGKGCIYSYDPIGHCEKTTYRAGGSAGALLQPLLDNQVYFNLMSINKRNLYKIVAVTLKKTAWKEKKKESYLLHIILQIGHKNQEGVTPTSLTQEKAIAILKDVFTSAAERDIYTGDGITIKIITKDGIQDISFALRKD